MSIAPTIKTERLILRPWRQSDLDPFAALNRDPKVMEFIPIPISTEESNAFVQEYEAEWKKRKYGRWALEVPSSPCRRPLSILISRKTGPYTQYSATQEMARGAFETPGHFGRVVAMVIT